MEYEIISDDVIHFPYALEDPEGFVNFFESTESTTIPKWTPWMSGGADHEDKDQYGLLKYINLQNLEAEEDDQIRETLAKFLAMHETATLGSFFEYINLIGTSESSSRKISQMVNSQRPPKSFTLKKYLPNKAMGPHPDSDEVGSYTVAMYLSSELSGGRLNFFTLDKYVDITPGSVVIYPSVFLHGSEDIFDGTKYLTNEVITVDVNLLDGRNAYA